MGDSESVSHEMCKLHREVIDTKLQANEKRIDGIEGKIDEVLKIQKNTLVSIIAILVVCLLIFIGVLLGRGVDFGLILGVL